MRICSQLTRVVKLLWFPGVVGCVHDYQGAHSYISGPAISKSVREQGSIEVKRQLASVPNFQGLDDEAFFELLILLHGPMTGLWPIVDSSSLP